MAEPRPQFEFKVIETEDVYNYDDGVSIKHGWFEALEAAGREGWSIAGILIGTAHLSKILLQRAISSEVGNVEADPL